ncbi:hypothetical protein BDV12DRAFT_205067 [Aspergillus spectabilis]
MAAPDLASCGFNFVQDPAENNWLSEHIYAQNPPFNKMGFDAGYDSMLGIQIPAHPLDTTSPVMINDPFPDVYGSLQTCNLPQNERISPNSQNDTTSGLFTFDNFSTTSTAETVPLPSLGSPIDSTATEKLSTALEKFSVSVDNICVSFERFAKRLDEASTAIERMNSQTESISNNTAIAMEGFNVKVDGLSGRIDGLVVTVGEIVKRERIAMEKFGNFAGCIDRPTSSMGSQSGTNLHRRSSG